MSRLIAKIWALSSRALAVSAEGRSAMKASAALAVYSFLTLLGWIGQGVGVVPSYESFDFR